MAKPVHCTPSLIAQLHFDEGAGSTAFDSSGHFSSGTLVNGAGWTTGQYGSGISFNGANQYVLIPQIPTNGTAGQDNTVTFWMYWNGNNLGSTFSFFIPSSNAGYGLITDGDCFGFNTGASECFGISSATVANRWVHVAGIFHNGPETSSQLYINGVQQALSCRVGSCVAVPTAASSATIGVEACCLASPQVPFSGKIDEVTVSSYGLSAAEIAGLAAAPPSGCGYTYNVRKDGLGNFTSIQSAVNGLPANLGTDTCVVIRDTNTYSEQVTVQGFSFATSTNTLKIMSDPAFISSAPAVSPPASSTAAFQIANASVTLQNINVLTANTVPYGVLASSNYVTVSSVNVDSGGKINFSGIRISSYSSIANSSITVQNAHGLYADGTLNTISRSTAVNANNGTGFYALFFNGASSSTLTQSYFSNPLSTAAFLAANANFNTISLSSVTGASGGPALDLNGVSSNTLAQSYFGNTIGPAVEINGGGYNTARLITAANSASIAFGVASRTFWVLGSSWNIITQSFISNAQADAGAMELGSAGNTISFSTFTSANTVGATFSINDPGSSSNTITQSYFDNGGIAPSLYIGYQNIGADHNNVSFSTFTRGIYVGTDYTSIANSSILADAYVLVNFENASHSGIYIDRASSATVSGCTVQGSTAVWVSRSTGTLISSSVLIATNSAGSALWINSTSNGLTLGSSTLTGGAQAAAITIDKNNGGAISFSSNTISGGRWGLYVASMTCGACAGNLSISTMIFSGGLAAGATAINFAGGTFVSTLSYVQFSDSNIGTDVNGAPLALGSRVTMLNYSGSKSGPAFEDDPNNLVDWVLSITTNIPPSNPAIAQTLISSITVSFGGVGADAYTAQASTASDFSGNISSAGSFSANPLTIGGLIANTTYYLRAGAVWGPATFYANTVPTSAITLAASPDPLVFVPPIGLNQFTVSWSTNGNPANTNYEADVSTDINFGILTSTAGTTALNLTFNSLIAHTTYFVRVKAINSGGTPSGYAFGAVITQTGVITISANRLTNFWYNITSALLFAQGASIYHYRITNSPVNTAVIGDPPFNGSGLVVPLSQGLNYFHVYGTDGVGTFLGTASFGPIDIDTGAPVVLSIAAQNSATDMTPILSGGSTLSTTPRFTWPAAGSLSPVVGYSFSLSTDAAVVPSPAINTTITFIDKILSRTGTYYAKVSALNLAGNLGAPAVMSITFTTTPSVSRVILKGNIFNPIKGPCAELDLQSASGGHMKAVIYNLLGQKVMSLTDQDASPGTYNYTWCGTNSQNERVASGIYYLRVETPEERKTYKLAVLK